MGDIKRLRKKYTTPGHPWNATRIKLERAIMKKYGVANKTEIWKMESVLKGFKDQAKSLLTRMDEQAEKERQQMTDRIIRLGLVSKSAGVDDILGLQLKDIMDRRLQTLVLKKRMARSIKHARQLITHEHILVGDRKVTSPSYLVLAQEESTVSFAPDSPFMRDDHPEAYDDEIMRKKLSGKKKDKKEDDQEIIVFEDVEDPEEVGSGKEYDASLDDIKDSADADPKPDVKEAPAKKEEKPAEEKKESPKDQPKAEEKPKEDEK